MPSESSPYLVRDDRAAELGAHSHSRARRLPIRPRRGRKLFGLRIAFFTLGIAGTGYYGYTLANQQIYQAYENWSFDEQIAGRSSVNFADYLREKTPLAFVIGDKMERPARPVAQNSQPSRSTVARPPDGAILGRVEIARLGISAIVREGVGSATLSRAVGHVPSTSLPGQPGNFAIAAHRDTLFRALKNIRLGDGVLFESSTGTYAYRVISSQIVRPSDVSVLRSDGGPRLLEELATRPARLLTMITCYPFNYLGAAPQRFIVQAEGVDGTPSPARTEVQRVTHPIPASHIGSGPLHTNATPRRTGPSWASQRPTGLPQAQNKPRKRGFWRRLFHAS